jgi:NAD(P)H-hydrate epimerase
MKCFNTLFVRRLDQIAQERFSIPGLLLMEHASLGLANHVKQYLKESNKRILILTGKGNNGGDGMAAARHLYNEGHEPEILLIGKKEDIRSDSDAFVNAIIAEKMSIPIMEYTETETILSHLKKHAYDIYLDAVFGTGLSSPLRSIYPVLFKSINQLNLPFIAVDVPSGLNADTGMPMGAAIKAFQTVTFAFAKIGFQKGKGPAYCGEVFVTGIGLPREVVEDPERFLNPH